MRHHLPCHTTALNYLATFAKSKRDQRKAESLLKSNVLKISVRKEKHEFAVAV